MHIACTISTLDFSPMLDGENWTVCLHTLQSLDFQFLQLPLDCINDKYITKHVLTCFPLISCEFVHSSSPEFVNSKINYLFSLILECFLQAGMIKMRSSSSIIILLSIYHLLFYSFQDIRRGWHFTNSTIMDQIMSSTAQTDLTKVYKRL